MKITSIVVDGVGKFGIRSEVTGLGSGVQGESSLRAHALCSARIDRAVAASARRTSRFHRRGQ